MALLLRRGRHSVSRLVSAAVGEADEAEARLRDGMTAYRATGSGLFLSGFLRMSAEAHGRIGKTSTALEAIRESFAVMQATSQRWDEAEMHRVHGGLLLACGDPDGAAAAFGRALAIARQQGAGLWELRAACDLARLRGEQRARHVAQDLLAAVVSRFATQAVARYRRARALLDELR
jgi:predicted ATPase